MKTSLSTVAVLAFTSALSLTGTADADDAKSGVSAPSKAAADITNGEVRKVDKDAKKITLKHEEIKNLEMPGMTMVFQVKDAALLDMAKAGDKVRFKAIKEGTVFVVTDIERVK